MKKHISTIILIIIMLIGISVLLYPTVSNYVNNKHQSRAIASYDSALRNISGKDLESIFNIAEEYNKKISTTKNVFFHPELVSGYENALNAGDNGIMGYITIEKINVELPLYHGTSEEVLQEAVGHLEGTSLPLGGQSTHCVLSAHCGLPGAKLFTDLERMEEGDTFVITILNRKITYMVDKITVVLPEQTDDLQIVTGKDYCTLMTCTPYGINSHRLLVRGIRVDNAKVVTKVHVTNDAYKIDKRIVTPILCVPALVVALLWLLTDDIIKTNKKRRKRRLNQDEKKN